MQLRKRTMGGFPVLCVAGRMAGDSEQEALHQAVRELVARGEKRIVIDLGQVEWMNSLGLGVLLACFITISNSGGQMAVSRVRHRVRALFKVLRVCRIFSCHETIKGALASLTGERDKSASAVAC